MCTRSQQGFTELTSRCANPPANTSTRIANTLTVRSVGNFSLISKSNILNTNLFACVELAQGPKNIMCAFFLLSLGLGCDSVFALLVIEACPSDYRLLCFLRKSNDSFSASEGNTYPGFGVQRRALHAGCCDSPIMMITTHRMSQQLLFVA